MVLPPHFQFLLHVSWVFITKNLPLLGAEPTKGEALKKYKAPSGTDASSERRLCRTEDDQGRERSVSMGERWGM